jgi:protein involved in polysaccharide export with SLBB domain
MMTFQRGPARGIMIGLTRMIPMKPKIPARIALLGLAVLGCLFATPRAATAASATSDQAIGSQGTDDVSAAAGLSQAPIEGRVDPDTYRVGPGDQFALRYSDLLDPKILSVAPSGDLLLPDVGSVPVAGLSLRAAEDKVRDALRPYVRGKGFVLTLFRPRRFRLPVLGDVAYPGVVTLQAPVRASEAIQAAGGVTVNGARRGIEVRRGSDTLQVDLVLYARAGDQAANPLVFETDVIFVPASRRIVEIQGAVPHPGGFDFVPGDRVSTLLGLAGGLLPDAAVEEAQVVHFREGGERATEPVRLAAALAAPGGADDAPLSEGDRLFIPRRSHWRDVPYVWLEGEVARPGPYPIEEGKDRILSVLERGGGFTSEADRGAVSVERVLSSVDPDTMFLRIAQEHDQILSPSERSYLMLRTRERKALSATVGRLLEAGDSLGNVLLYRGDRIFVPRRVFDVSVQGEVRAPGHVPYIEGHNVDYYVKEAGDYTSRAYKSRVKITLAATGRQVGSGDAKALMPGDIVWVPTKPERNPWATIRDIVGVAAAAAAIVIAVEAVNNNP